MSTHSEIDETLGLLGNVEPPSGLESRVKMRLQAPHRSLFPVSIFRTVAAGALAASVALSAVVLSPGLRNMVFHHGSAQNSAPVLSPRVVAP